MFTLQIRILSNGALSVYGATYFSASPSPQQKYRSFGKNTLNESRWQTMMSGQMVGKKLENSKKIMSLQAR
jgi:hypothetical protein